MAIETTDNLVVATALVIAMCRRLGDGLLQRLVDALGRAARPEAAHASPPSDPCAGSDADDAWEAIGFIAAAGRARHRRIIVVFRFHSPRRLRRNKYRSAVRTARPSKSQSGG